MMSRTLASGKAASKWVLFEKRFVIPDYDNPKEPSRIRWRLFSCPYFGVYLHKWLKPDPRPTPHNHPWPFFSLILRGNYADVGWIRGSGLFTRFWGFNFWFNRVPRNVFHTVTQVAPGTLSLMFVGRDRECWGYIDSDFNYIPFEEHPHTAEFRLALAEGGK